ncbi:MAG: hypothetical protein PUC32_01710 [Oscillospiraceae bacterium]|nr:hypothetical protein [Oscillospiraceae bacterium]
MQFKDKLVFLMQITQTSNKELAEGISVDPSLISLLRTGKRQLPRDWERLQKMALFFAGRCTADFQRRALAEMLGYSDLRSSMPTELLANRLAHWMKSENDLIDSITEELQHTELPVSTQQEAPAPMPKEQTMFFYGEEGRREVTNHVFQAIREAKTPCSILLASDDNLEWLLSDYQLSKRIQNGLLDVLRQGFTFYQIMPAINFLSRYTEAMRFWLPAYSTGKMKVYYYPRLRDNLYRRSTLIVPGHCVRVSSSIGPSNNFITLFSTDPKLVKAYTEQFQEHLYTCRPALNGYTKFEEFLPFTQELLAQPGDVIHQVVPLSPNTIPRALLEQCVREERDPVWKQTFAAFLKGIPQFEQRLSQYHYLEISRLPSVEEIRSGTIRIGTPYKSCASHLFYTPKTYAMHLRNIVRLMDQYENYCFLPLERDPWPDYNLMVNEEGLALLFRISLPPLMLELRRPELVMACREHLLRSAEQTGYEGIHRTKIRIRLIHLIEELER